MQLIVRKNRQGCRFAFRLPPRRKFFYESHCLRINSFALEPSVNAHFRYAAESGSDLSCRVATVPNTMAETDIDRPTVAKPRSRKSATVSASALALHLDCSRAYIGKLEAEGVIQRHGDGFPLDQSRVAYLRKLATRAAAISSCGSRR